MYTAPPRAFFLLFACRCCAWQVLQAAGAPAAQARQGRGTLQQAEEHGDVGPLRPERTEHEKAYPRPERGLEAMIGERLFAFFVLFEVGKEESNCEVA